MREAVLQVILDSETPKYLSEIAKEMNESSQIVHYHLLSLVQEGVLLTYTEDRKRYYALQPVQYKYPPSELYEIIMPLVENMAKYIECSQTDESPARVIANNLLLLLERLTVDIDGIFEDVNGSS